MLGGNGSVTSIRYIRAALKVREAVYADFGSLLMAAGAFSERGLMVFNFNVKPPQGYYVEYEALNGDMGSVRLVDASSDDGGTPPVTFGGRPIDPANVPTRVRWKDRRKQPMGDFDGGPLESVSSRAKALIEAFEPGVHQFLPVQFVDIDSDFLEDRWFLIVCNRLDTIDRDKVSGFLLRRGKVWTPIKDYLRRMPEDIPPGYDPTQPSVLVFNRSQIGSAHLWIDLHLSPSIWVSDRFDAACEAEGLTGRITNHNRRDAV